jgi:hypothetical protein
MLAGEPSILTIIEEGPTWPRKTIGAPQIVYRSAACFPFLEGEAVSLAL